MPCDFLGYSLDFYFLFPVVSLNRHLTLSLGFASGWARDTSFVKPLCGNLTSNPLNKHKPTSAACSLASWKGAYDWCHNQPRCTSTVYGCYEALIGNEVLLFKFGQSQIPYSLVVSFLLLMGRGGYKRQDRENINLRSTRVACNKPPIWVSTL